jgi:hypothetical protein
LLSFCAKEAREDYESKLVGKYKRKAHLAMQMDKKPE